MTAWVRNSLRGGDRATLAVHILGWLVIAGASLSLGHLYYLTTRKKSTSIRRLTVYACTVSLSAGIVVVTIALAQLNAGDSVVLSNLLVNGCMVGGVQAIDKSVLILANKAISNASSSAAQRYIIITLIIILLFLSWLPTYTILPLFFDMNDPRILDSYVRIGEIVLVACTAIFHSIWSYKFMNLLVSNCFDRSSSDAAIQAALKTVMYSVIRYAAYMLSRVVHLTNMYSAVATAVRLMTTNTLLASLVYMFSVSSALYILFNSSIGKTRHVRRQRRSTFNVLDAQLWNVHEMSNYIASAKQAVIQSVRRMSNFLHPNGSGKVVPLDGSPVSELELARLHVQQSHKPEGAGTVRPGSFEAMKRGSSSKLSKKKSSLGDMDLENRERYEMKKMGGHCDDVEEI